MRRTVPEICDRSTGLFDRSAGKGILLCYANNNLSAKGAIPSPAFDINTVEKSDVGYASLPVSYPNGEFYQPFGVGTV